MNVEMRRDERGSIVMAVLVIFVAGLLAATTASLVQSGLRSSRRAGDSANALQLADAAVNDAVKRVTDYSGPVSPLPTIAVTGSLGGAGSYTGTATMESATAWRIDAVGVDATGVRRRVKATAVAESLFANAVFTQSTMNFHSGSSVDSFVNGLNQPNTCTRKGFVGTNSPATTDLSVSGGGGGVVNCTQGTSDPDVTYDGCVGYADDEPVPGFLNAPGTGVPTGCGAARKDTPRFSVDPPDSSGITLQPSPLVCTATTVLTPGTYRYPSVTLQDGCSLAAAATFANPVKLYSDGAIKIGTTTNAKINQPSSSCPNTASSGSDYFPSGSPLWYYCPGWAGRLQIFGSGSGSVVFENNSEFWGIVVAPSYVLGGGSGNPQAKVWGALVGSSLATNAQFAVHYDESLAALTTGRFNLASWREEPLT